LDPLGKALPILQRLVKKDPTNSDWRLQLGVCHSRMAAALASLDAARARSEAHTAMDVLGPLLQGEPDEPTRGLIAEAEVTRGRIEAAVGARDPARASWERALAILAPCPRPLTHWKVLSPWVQALLELDRVEEARPGVERLAKMGYRSPDLAKRFERVLSESPEL